jgi:hypothetical protein
MTVEMRLELSERRYQKLLERVTRSESEAATFAGEREYFQSLVQQGREEVVRLLSLIEEKDAAIAALEARTAAKPQPASKKKAGG